MFVVKTIPQLEEAVREGAREVMIVGKLAPEMLEMTDSFAQSDCQAVPSAFSFTQLFNKFNVLAVHDDSQKVIATLFQQRDDLSTP